MCEIHPLAKSLPQVFLLWYGSKENPTLGDKRETFLWPTCLSIFFLSSESSINFLRYVQEFFSELLQYLLSIERLYTDFLSTGSSSVVKPDLFDYDLQIKQNQDSAIKQSCFTLWIFVLYKSFVQKLEIYSDAVNLTHAQNDITYHLTEHQIKKLSRPDDTYCVHYFKASIKKKTLI